MANTETTASGGIGFCGMLTILFIGLKLTGHIDWAWWWVLGPLWIPLSVILVIALIVLVAICVFVWCKVICQWVYAGCSRLADWAENKS